MFCRFCGKKIPENANVCPYCGKRLKQVSAPAAQTEMLNSADLAGEKQSSAVNTAPVTALPDTAPVSATETPVPNFPADPTQEIPAVPAEEIHDDPAMSAPSDNVETVDSSAPAPEVPNVPTEEIPTVQTEPVQPVPVQPVPVQSEPVQPEPVPAAPVTPVVETPVVPAAPAVQPSAAADIPADRTQTASAPISSNQPSANTQNTYSQVNQTAAPQPAPAQKTKTKKPSEPGAFSKWCKKNPVALSLIIVAAVCAIAAAVYFVMPHGMNMSKYITVNVGSGSSEGKVFARFDKDSFEQDAYKAKGIDVALLDEYSSSSITSSGLAKYAQQKYTVQAINELAESIEVAVTPSTNVSASDKVTVSATYNKSYLAAAKLSLTHTKYTKKVSDLPGLTEFDPFENISVKFSGVSPDLQATVEGADSYDQFNGTYEINDSRHIAVGDTVTVEYTGSEDAANEKGYTIASTSKDFTCEKAAKYLEDVSEISSDTMTKMQDASLNKIKSWMASNSDFKSPSYYSSVSDPSYVGTYLLMSKDTDYTYTYNYALVIYKIDAKSYSVDSSWDTKYDDATIYLPVKIENIQESEDGKQSYESSDANLSIIGDSYLKSSGKETYHSMDGYLSLDTFYKDCIQKNISQYTASATDGLTSSSSSSSSTTATATPASSGNTVIGTLVITADRLRIRDQAATSGNKVGYAEKNQKYDVYESTTGEGFTWYRIGDNQWVAFQSDWGTYTPAS